MIIRSNIITADDVVKAAGAAGVSFQDTFSEPGYFVPVRKFTPRRFARGFEVFLTGSGKHASAHDRSEKCATWTEWGVFIDALYDIDPKAQIGFYRDRAHFIEYTTEEVYRRRTFRGEDIAAPWLEDDREVQFATLTRSDAGALVETSVRTIRQSDIAACPFVIFVADHYREDGSCKCDDPVERARMIAEWEYTEADFAAIPLREEVTA